MNLAAVVRSFTACAVEVSMRILAKPFRNTRCQSATRAATLSPLGDAGMRFGVAKAEHQSGESHWTVSVALDRVLKCHPRTACAAVVQHGTIRLDETKADYQSVAIE